MREKTSIIWKIPVNDLFLITKQKTSLTGILRYYGLENKGGHSHTLKRRLNTEGIDYSHIPLGLSSNKGRKFPNSGKPLDTYLIKNSNYNRCHLKRRLIKENRLKDICDECGCKPIWNDKKLSLQLHHKNGNSKDHRIKNLQLLCPNCHSQTNTFARRVNRIKHNCKKCQKEISGKGVTNLCVSCSNKTRQFK